MKEFAYHKIKEMNLVTREVALQSSRAGIVNLSQIGLIFALGPVT